MSSKLSRSKCHLANNYTTSFFAYRALPHLDRKHTVFGRLIDDPTPSSATLNRLEANPVESTTNRPTPEIRIKDVTIFVDPFEDFLKKKRAEDTQDPTSTIDESEASRRADDDQITWTGKRVRGPGANDDGGSTGVGKYLKAALADREEDEIVEFVDEPEPEPEPARKKAKGMGGIRGL